MSSDPDKYFQFKSSFTAFGNNQWRKGGMTYGGLKDSTQAINYMYGPGRSNLIPDPNGKSDFTTTNPSYKPVVSSIGLVQSNGLGQIASGNSGPGTLYSTNLSVKNPVAASDPQYGALQSNPNKMNFVNYRNTDPSLVQNLRENPLSIYAQGNDVKNKEIPPFFADIKPQNYSTYVHENKVDISEDTKKLYIDGSPNVSILGLAQQNPFLGMGHVIPNTNPEFTGKVYGGNNSGDANVIAENLYNSVWTSSDLNKQGPKSESFIGSSEMCDNKALVQFAQGYNVAPQLLESKMIISGGPVQNNLPWGPIKVTGNPRTQQGGIWQGDSTTRRVNGGIENIRNRTINKTLPPKRFVNPYKNGMPGTLIS